LWAPGYPDEGEPYNATFLTTRTARYAQAGIEVLVLVPGPSREYRYDGIRVVRAPIGQLPALTRAFAAQVVAVHAPRWRWEAALRTLDVPAVYWVHGAEALWTLTIPRPARWLDLQRRRLRAAFRVVRQQLFLRRLLKDARQPVVTVSAWMARRIRRGLLLGDLPIRVIPNPIDVDLFPLRPTHAAPGSTVMLRDLSNRLYGFADAIRAFDARSKTPDGTLTIVGEGTELERYRRLARRLRAPVCFVPRMVPHAELPELLARFAIILNPTARDTHGVTMCEAMALGLPVVAYRVAAIPEYVRDGIDGILVRRGDVAGLRAAVERLTRDHGFYESARLSAAAYVREICAPDPIVAAELELLTSAAVANRGRGTVP